MENLPDPFYLILGTVGGRQPNCEPREPPHGLRARRAPCAQNPRTHDADLLRIFNNQTLLSDNIT